MSTPHERARDQDRDAAIALVEGAWSDGQIVEADRDKRVAELARAQTLGEIQLLTQGLEPPMNRPVPAPAPVPTTVSYGPAVTSVPTTPTAARLPKSMLVVPLVVVLVIGIAVVGGLVALLSGTDDPIAVGGSSPAGADADVLSASGYDDLVAAVRDATGGTTVFSAVLYPTYAVVDLPVDATTKRTKSYYWDGDDLEDQDSKSTSTNERFDLGAIDGAVVVGLVEKVRRLSDEPTSWYAIVRSVDPGGDGSMIWAYASNDYHESVYVGARPDGKITYNSTEH